MLLLASCADDAGDTDSADSTGTTDGSTTGGDRPPRPPSDVVVGEGLPCDVAKTLATHCWACHGETPMTGAPYSLVSRSDLLLDSSTPDKTRGQRSLERMRADMGPMPPVSLPRVPAAEIDVLEAWLAAGSPEETCEMMMGGGDCVSCLDIQENILTCAPRGEEMPNLCNQTGGMGYFICADQKCGETCGFSAFGEPATMCDPANAEVCQACLDTNCKAELEACAV